MGAAPVRRCGGCANSIPAANHDGICKRTGYCTHPYVGRVVDQDDGATCPWFTPAAGQGFDENSALQAFEKMKDGKLGPQRTIDTKPINTDLLRARTARDIKWGDKPWRRA